jgi:putative NADPH-quinone reductase
MPWPKFDPCLPAKEIPEQGPLPMQVARACEELTLAEGLVFVHPNWWGQPPAILKGWVDRVIRPGVAYRFLPGDQGEGVPQGLLRARCALVFNTSNTPLAREQKVFGDPLERIWADCILHFCGVGEVRRRMFSTVADSTPEQRASWLEEARALVRDVFPLSL